MLLLQLIIAVFLAYGIYLLASLLFKWPKKAASKCLRRSGVKTNPWQKMYAGFTAPVIKLLMRVIRLPPYKRRKLLVDLERAGLYLSPEEYFSQAIIKGVCTALLSIPMFLLGIPIAGMGCMGMGVITYFRETQKVSDKLKAKDEEIAFALPHFCLTISEMLKGGRDFQKIFAKYLRDVPNTPLRTDITKLLARLESNTNTAEALQAFGASLSVPLLSSFISGLIEITKGVDQSTYFGRVGADMLALTRENIRRKMAKRPRKIKMATLCMLGCFVAVLLTPIIIQLIDGFSLFN